MIDREGIYLFVVKRQIEGLVVFVFVFVFMLLVSLDR